MRNTDSIFDIINAATAQIFDGPYRSMTAAAEMAVRCSELTGQPLMAVERPTAWTPTYYATRYAAWSKRARTTKAKTYYGEAGT